MIPLVLIVNSGAFGSAWIPENLDDGHLTYYFFLLAGIMTINQIVFYRISAGYEYKTDADLKFLEENDDEEDFNLGTVKNPI